MTESKQRHCPMCGRFMRYHGQVTPPSYFRDALHLPDDPLARRDRYTCPSCGLTVDVLCETGRVLLLTD